MKTAIQIAIESYKNDGVSFTDWFMDNYEILLKKEKEQMIDFHIGSSKNTKEYGTMSSTDEKRIIENSIWKAEQYYLKTYNQNK
jgi:hypothetical protein